MPYIASSYIIKSMTKQGYENIQLSLKSLSHKHVLLEELAFNNNDTVNIDTILISFDLPNLFNKKVDTITIDGLNYNFENTSSNTAPFSYELVKPVMNKHIDRLNTPGSQSQPFKNLNITDSHIRFVNKHVLFDAPFEMAFKSHKDLTLRLPHAAIDINKNNISLEKVETSFELKPDSTKSPGLWSIDNIALSKSNKSTDDTFSASGTMTLKSNLISIDGTLTIHALNNNLDFTLELTPNDIQSSTLKTLPYNFLWKGGSIKIKEHHFVLSKPTHELRVEVKRVSLGALLEALTGEKVSATGTLSGEIPLIIAKDASIQYKDATLNADGPGTISMPASTIPGSGSQINFVREILKELNFTQLSISLSEDENTPPVTLSLTGSNPKIENGRPINLNVNLTGDVITFLQQNILYFNDPKTLLRHELP
jgi:hypothetical protein